MKYTLCKGLDNLIEGDSKDIVEEFKKSLHNEVKDKLRQNCFGILLCSEGLTLTHDFVLALQIDMKAIVLNVLEEIKEEIKSYE